MLTSVTVNNNSPIQDYIHPDDQTQPFDMTPGFKPFTFMSMLSNQGLGKYMYYQPRPFTLTTTLIIPDVTKTLSNNKLFIVVLRNLNLLSTQNELHHFDHKILKHKHFEEEARDSKRLLKDGHQHLQDKHDSLVKKAKEHGRWVRTFLLANNIYFIALEQGAGTCSLLAKIIGSFSKNYVNNEEKGKKPTGLVWPKNSAYASCLL